MKLRYLLLMMSFFISSCSFAQEQPNDNHHKKQVISIPKDIKLLLTQETQAVEKGMQALLSTIAKGQWSESIKIAKQIQSSYILKKSLSPEQKKHLHHSLPKHFLMLDHSFHQYAGMLADAAEAKNSDIVNFYFYKMTDSCVQCHSRYANNKFPELSFSTDKHQ